LTVRSLIGLNVRNGLVESSYCQLLTGNSKHFSLITHPMWQTHKNKGRQTGFHFQSDMAGLAYSLAYIT